MTAVISYFNTVINNNNNNNNNNTIREPKHERCMTCECRFKNKPQLKKKVYCRSFSVTVALYIAGMGADSQLLLMTKDQKFFHA